MRLVIQRVKYAKLEVENKTISEINQGLLVFLGITHSDNFDIAKKYAQKASKLRIFEDENGKINKSTNDINGEFLVVSNFTLYGEATSNRPSFSNAAKGGVAEPIYDYFCEELNKLVPTKKGVFGADMQIQIHADGPVTLIIDSDK